MKLRVIMPIVAGLCAFGLTAGHAGTPEPSSQCNKGQLPPSMTPLGVGINGTGDPGAAAGSLVLCFSGPFPIEGAVTVAGSLGTQSGYVEADGDSTTQAQQKCADGFVRVDTRGNFYSSPDGSYKDTNPKKKGNQQARPKDAPTFLQETGANC